MINVVPTDRPQPKGPMNLQWLSHRAHSFFGLALDLNWSIIFLCHQALRRYSRTQMGQSHCTSYGRYLWKSKPSFDTLTNTPNHHHHNSTQTDCLWCKNIHYLMELKTWDPAEQNRQKTEKAKSVDHNELRLPTAEWGLYQVAATLLRSLLQMHNCASFTSLVDPSSAVSHWVYQS